ncbi:MAG: glycosyltransferase family 4 protein [Actinomycetota bacterium]
MPSGSTSPCVALVVDRFPAETFLAQQVVALRRRGVDLHVLCQIADDLPAAVALLDGADLDGRIHPWPDRDERLARFVAAGRTLARAARRSPGGLVRALRSELRAGTDGAVGRLLFDARLLAVGADVVHFQFGDLARARTHVARATDVAFSASFRGYDLTYAGLDEPSFYDDLWPALDGAHTLGVDLRSRARDRGAPADLAWTLIPPAVDLGRFDPGDRTQHDGPLRVLCLGRLHWKKAHDHAVAAVAAVRGAGVDVELRIAGSGDAEEAVRWAIDDLRMADRATLIGQLDPDEVVEQLRWADVLLHPSLTEGFANAVVEAQAMGVPVVASDAEGLRENVVDGVTGYVVARRDIGALVDRLLLLARDPDLRRRLGDAGRERAETHFSLDAQTDAFVDFFASTTQRRRRRR